MARRPTAEDRDACEILQNHDQLTEWEEGFLESLANQERWSVKQGQIFDDLWCKLKE